MENLTIEKILQLMRKNARLISVFALSGLVVGILYSLIVFRPMYKSTARLLIKDALPTTFVSELNTGNQVSTLMANGNPTLTQMEIIASESLATQVWQKISEKYNFKNSQDVGIKMMQKAIEVKNPVGTDILEVTAGWKTPQIAQDIAKAYQDAYINLNVESARQSVGQSKKSIDVQFEDAQRNLQAVREEIKNFRQSFSTVNIERESENIVTQLADLENRYSEVASDAAAAADRRKAIAENLGLEWNDAISSVAIGHNDNFTELQRRLGEAQEEQAGLATKYASTHPAMVALDARIAKIKAELTEQIQMTLGDKEIVNPMIITDPVRTGMLEEFAANEAEYQGLIAQSNILSNIIQSLKYRRAELPRKQLTLANLTQEEENWTNVVNALKAKQIEAQIKESEIISNIKVIDAPALAKFAAFPGRFHVVLLFGLLGTLLGIAGTLIDYLIKNVYDNVEDIERELKVPVLGSIPWIERETYYEPETSLAIDDVSSFYSLAYQKTIANIGLKGYQNGVKTLMFTSTEYSKARSTILMNTAIGLSKAGYSVAIVDADFRTPSIHQEFKVSRDTNLFSLSRLLKMVTSQMQAHQDVDWNLLSDYLQKPFDTKLSILTNTETFSEPYQYLNSPAMSVLIQKLKENYNWVLIDVPPVMAVPDAMTIGQNVDGAVLTVGLESARSNVRRAYKTLVDNNINVFGVIAREIQSNEAASTNEYIKQIISRMMPEEDDMYSEQK